MKDHIRIVSCIFWFVLLHIPAVVTAQKRTRAVHFDQDTLVLNDGISLQRLLWKDGKLCWLDAQSLRTGQKMRGAVTAACMPVLDPFTAEEWSSDVVHHGATSRSNAYSAVLFTTKYDSFEIKLTIRVYEHTAGAEWGFEVTGKAGKMNTGRDRGLSMIENKSALQRQDAGYFYLPAGGHFTARIACFKAATDYYNNLVQEINAAPYTKPQYYPGNVLQIQYERPGAVHELVKLSPLQEAQSAYAGYDFSAAFDGVRVYSPGWEAAGPDSAFQKGYSVYVVMFARDKNEAAAFYKQYEMSRHHYIPALDNTFTMNTWGDRHRDGRIRESFILKELRAASRLGITHYQIDDGWQQGTSQNSAKQGGALWDHWSAADWQVNKQRFPDGLEPVVKAARAKGITMGLWLTRLRKTIMPPGKGMRTSSRICTGNTV